MGALIDALMDLSQLARKELKREPVDMSAMVQAIAGDLKRQHPERQVDLDIQPGVACEADPRLIRLLLQNLLDNAWKFSSRKPHAHIEFGLKRIGEERTYFVRDDGVGFDMAMAGKLFGVFQRLHSQQEFPGHGVGLATVARIVHSHRGRIWAESEVDKGTTFFFTLSA